MTGVCLVFGSIDPKRYEWRFWPFQFNRIAWSNKSSEKGPNAFAGWYIITSRAHWSCRSALLDDFWKFPKIFGRFLESSKNVQKCTVVRQMWSNRVPTCVYGPPGSFGYYYSDFPWRLSCSLDWWIPGGKSGGLYQNGLVVDQNDEVPRKPRLILEGLPMNSQNAKSAPVTPKTRKVMLYFRS